MCAIVRDRWRAISWGHIVISSRQSISSNSSIIQQILVFIDNTEITVKIIYELNQEKQSEQKNVLAT